ncbi:MAG TPA: OsmC family protein [Acidimicrobiales bacterium]|nr:OsmC family protein [Acidimicrobiales bacterium]
MTTVRHIAQAVASTGSNVPAYRVDIRVGNHQLVADEPPDTGGDDFGPSPFGLLTSALAACTATTLRMYAERHDWELSTIDVDARYEVDDNRHGTIARSITVPADMPGEQLDALASIADRTPVTRAIRAGTPITTTMRRGS